MPTRLVQTRNSPLGVLIGTIRDPPETTSRGSHSAVSKYDGGGWSMPANIALGARPRAGPSCAGLPTSAGELSGVLHTVVRRNCAKVSAASTVSKSRSMKTYAGSSTGRRTRSARTPYCLRSAANRRTPDHTVKSLIACSMCRVNRAAPLLLLCGAGCRTVDARGRASGDPIPDFWGLRVASRRGSCGRVRAVARAGRAHLRGRRGCRDRRPDAAAGPARRLRRTVGFDAYSWLMTDPETAVGTAPLADVPCLPELTG